jgi:hypothetical protein
VLVTNWNPLTIWFYNECYIRFCAEPFTLRDLDNNYIHLTNNSVAKHSDKWHELNIGEGNMWDFRQFQVRARRLRALGGFAQPSGSVVHPVQRSQHD